MVRRLSASFAFAATGGVLFGLVAGCRSEVEVVDGGTGGSSTPTTTGQGGCGESCIECCNDPQCPEVAPLPYAACYVEAGTHCGWIDDDGCVDSRYCDDKKWNSHWGPTCPGECPEAVLAAKGVCLDPGLECILGDGDDCVSTVCGDDHRWTELKGATCP